jgi:hypothetical protein
MTNFTETRKRGISKTGSIHEEYDCAAFPLKKAIKYLTLEEEMCTY